ncbi:radial spoke head protein 9 homolog [Hydra vulgaris]|uniref:radial spoke head protein 9 homolog n=1 Tax=Hydra vulgaris TaxID=6087 RepID=UPI001F5E88CF|nr:radial spoke head protein 9 homolog [Hydra vulgaris]
MNIDSLQVACDYVSSSGFILSVEKKTALQASLTLVKDQQKFEKVYFLGKIIGLQNDYFICQGIENDELANRKTLYSVDCVKWGLIPNPNEETRRKCSMIKGRFIGDPSYIYENPSEKKSDDEHPNDTSIKEEDRLAVTVENIYHDVSVVPRGAFIRTSLGQVHKNKLFSGLTQVEAMKLSSYFHFRNPVLLQNKSLLEKADLDKALDFLDPIDVDIPQCGSWSLQQERGGAVIVLRSLHWLGFTAYHVPETQIFGCCYCGYGEKNLDLPFML